jgi:hypothetical protein
MRRLGVSIAEGFVTVLLLGLVSVFILAKHGQYLPKSNPANFTSKTVKISRDGSFKRRTERKSSSEFSPPFPTRATLSSPLRIQEETLPPTKLTYLSSNQLRSPPLALNPA